jgi:hypothetical protein
MKELQVLKLGSQMSFKTWQNWQMWNLEIVSITVCEFSIWEEIFSMPLITNA